MKAVTKQFRSLISGKFLPRSKDRNDPDFMTWIVEVALDVQRRENEAAAIKLALAEKARDTRRSFLGLHPTVRSTMRPVFSQNIPSLFRTRDGRFWSLRAELKSRPWELLPYHFVIDWVAK
jgi:hypothetical protein